MEVISFFVHAYLYVLIYELLTDEEKKDKRVIFIFLLGCTKYLAETTLYTKHLAPFIICTILILYSKSIDSKQPYFQNLQYAVVVYGIDYILSAILGSVSGVVAGLNGVGGRSWMYLILSIGRLVTIIVLYKMRDQFKKIRQAFAIYIGVIATGILIFVEQLIRLAYTAEQYRYINIAVTCIFMVLFFTILWLLDHHKMAKVQKLYEEDNRQMSQKLHRSKEILPMIANYVSNMDGTQDERMREKLEEVCHDYGKELGGAEMSAELFETTGIDLVNLLLRTKIIECSEQDIELDVFVSTQIDKDMKRQDVSDGEITRLLGDLLRNAIHAVEDLSNKMILLLIARDENGCVLIRIYDSGIPFPDHILERFGERGNTTWGTGNGLADLMETVTRVQASIEINTEMAPEDVFTKEISICFDGKGNVNIIKKDEK